MKKTRVNINSFYNSVYAIIGLLRKYSMAPNKESNKQKQDLT
jgi:hypothetical protein